MCNLKFNRNNSMKVTFSAGHERWMSGPISFETRPFFASKGENTRDWSSGIPFPFAQIIAPLFLWRSTFSITQYDLIWCDDSAGTTAPAGAAGDAIAVLAHFAAVVIADYTSSVGAGAGARYLSVRWLWLYGTYRFALWTEDDIAHDIIPRGSDVLRLRREVIK